MAPLNFGIDASTVVRSLNPTGNINLFSVGGAGGVDPTDLEEVIRQNCEFVASRLRTKYSEWLARVDDEIFFGFGRKYAEGGETEVNVTASPAVGTDLYAWINYPLERIQWNDRWRYAAAYCAKCTKNADGSKLLLPVELKKDDTLIVSYDHDALNNCAELRGYVLELIWAHYAQRMPYLNQDAKSPAEVRDRVAVDLYHSYEKANSRGLYFFDNINHAKAVRSTRKTSHCLPTGGL